MWSFGKQQQISRYFTQLLSLVLVTESLFGLICKLATSMGGLKFIFYVWCLRSVGALCFSGTSFTALRNEQTGGVFFCIAFFWRTNLCFQKCSFIMSASFSPHKTQSDGIAFTHMLTTENLFNFFDSLFQVVYTYTVFLSSYRFCFCLKYKFS